MGYQLIKGNEAIVKGALLAGCRSYYGYPITPASEIAESAAKLVAPEDTIVSLEHPLSSRASIKLMKK